MRNIQLNFHHIDVNSISGSSGIFLGTNIQIKVSSSNKANNGFSTNGHNNQLMRNFSLIKDDDGVEVTTASV